MNNPEKQANLETKIKHYKENEWIPTGDKEEWYGYEYECPYCGHITLDAGNYCSNCGKKMCGGNIDEEEVEG